MSELFFLIGQFFRAGCAHRSVQIEDRFHEVPPALCTERLQAIAARTAIEIVEVKQRSAHPELIPEGDVRRCGEDLFLHFGIFDLECVIQQAKRLFFLLLITIRVKTIVCCVFIPGEIGRKAFDKTEMIEPFMIGAAAIWPVDQQTVSGKFIVKRMKDEVHHL